MTMTALIATAQEMQWVAEAALADRTAAVDAYVAALGAWRVAHERALSENRMTVARAQAALDKEFDRYEVAYAAVGDGDDKPYRETAWADAPEPDLDGYWNVFDNGNLVRRRLLRPMWVSEAVTEKLSEAGNGPWRRAYYVHDAGQSVYYLPWDGVELHRQLKTRTPLPAEPEPPAFLSDGMTAVERGRIAEVTRGMARVDIPF